MDGWQQVVVLSCFIYICLTQVVATVSLKDMLYCMNSYVFCYFAIWTINASILMTSVVRQYGCISHLHKWPPSCPYLLIVICLPVLSLSDYLQQLKKRWPICMKFYFSFIMVRDCSYRTATTNSLIIHPPHDSLVNMEYWWNDIDGKPKYSERNLFQCHFVHHKSLLDCPGNDRRCLWWEASD